jgi:type I restriction enzyme, S subunit
LDNPTPAQAWFPMKPPEGWSLEELQALMEPNRTITYGILKTGEPTEDGIPTVRGGDIKNFGVQLDRLKRVHPSIHAEYQRTHLTGGEVLVAIRGTVGNTAVAQPKLAGCNISREVAMVPVSEGIAPEFIAYLLGSPTGQRIMSGHVKGIAQRGINLKDLRELPTPVPPLNEQRRIVAKIEDLSARSRAAKQALDAIPPLLERFRQSVLAAAFRGDLTKQWRQQNPNTEPATELLKRIRQERRHRWEQDYLAKQKAKGKQPKNDKWKEKYKEPESVTIQEAEDLPSLPKTWEWIKLGEMAWSVKDGPHYSPGYSETGIPFISGGNVRPSGVDFINAKRITPELHAELSKRCCPELGDVLYTKGGTTGIARVNTYNEAFNVWVHVAVLKLVGAVLPFYVQHCLNSPLSYAQSQRYTRGVGNQDLGLTRMVKIVMALPPLAEQAAIIKLTDEYLNCGISVGQRLEPQRQRIAMLEQSILAKAFRGELVPQDPNDEPAFALLERIRAEREAAQPNRSRRKARTS